MDHCIFLNLFCLSIIVLHQSFCHVQPLTSFAFLLRLFIFMCRESKRLQAFSFFGTTKDSVVVPQIPRPFGQFRFFGTVLTSFQKKRLKIVGFFLWFSQDRLSSLSYGFFPSQLQKCGCCILNWTHKQSQAQMFCYTWCSFA